MPAKAKAAPPKRKAAPKARKRPAAPRNPPGASRKPASPPDPTTAYARDVAAGRVVAGKLVIAAGRRHLDDLETGHLRGLRWCPEEAQVAFEFFAHCPHLKGKKARAAFDLEPWQKFIIGSAIGWKRADGTRRFRYLWIEVARKNGKTFLMAPLALYLLVLDGEEGAEVYSVATKKDQARLVYKAARQMVIRTEYLRELITPYRDSLQVESTFGLMEPLGADADTLDGLNPSGIVADEVHKWRTRELFDVMDTATGARSQPLFACITTAGKTGSETVYGQEHEHYRSMLEGKIPNNDELFAYIATLDSDDDWSDPANFIKANPNLGVSVDAKEIAAAVRKAKAQPAAAGGIKRLRLNMRTGSADAWIPHEVWTKGKRELDWDLLRTYPLAIALDMASTTDIASACIAVPLTESGGPVTAGAVMAAVAFFWRFWVPKDSGNEAQTRLRQVIGPWVAAGLIKETEGDAIDEDTIEADIRALAAECPKLEKFLFDPFNAKGLGQRLAKSGLPVEEFGQRMALYAEPCKRLEELTANAKAWHDNAVADWMVDNCVVVENGAGHKMPSRKKSKNKIDGVAAALMALAGALRVTGRPRSYYDEHDAEFV